MKKVIIGFLLLSLLLAGCNRTPSGNTEITEPSVTEVPLPGTTWVSPIADYLNQEELSSPITLNLTPEQAAGFSSARFVLLQRWGETEYEPLYFSKNVTLENGVLTASFNGKVIYAVNQENTCVIPRIEELKTQDGQTHYCISISLNSDDGSGTSAITNHDLHLLVDAKTGQIQKSRLLPRREQPTEDLFSGEDPADLYGNAQQFYLPHNSHIYLTRAADGSVLPLEQWRSIGSTSTFSWHAGYDLAFLCGRLATVNTQNPIGVNDCYMLFEVTNTDGSTWCSEPLPVPVEKTAVSIEEPPVSVIDLNWEQGNKLTILEEDGIGVYIRKCAEGLLDTSMTYAWELKNETDETVYLSIDNLVGNDRLEGSGPSITAEPGQWESGIIYSAFLNTKGLHEIPKVLETLSFDLRVLKNNVTGPKLLPERHINIHLNSQTAVQTEYIVTHEPITRPCLGAMAEEQVLVEQDDVRVTLLALGASAETETLKAILRLENTGDTEKQIRTDSIIINGTYLFNGPSVVLTPGAVEHLCISVSKDNLTQSKISQIHSIEIACTVTERSASIYEKIVKNRWYPVTLSQAAEKPEEFWENDPILLDTQGLQLRLHESKKKYGRNEWTVVVINNTGSDIALWVNESASEPTPPSFHTLVGNGQVRVAQFSGGLEDLDNPVSLIVLDYHEGQILFDTPEFILPAITES